MSKREAVPKHSLPPQKQILSYMGRFINCPYAPDTEASGFCLFIRGPRRRSLAMTMIREVLYTTGITVTAGIGTNLYLAKLAMDITAKHAAPDKDGVRIAELDEESFRYLLWDHKPLTDFWQTGPGTVRRLEKHGIHRGVQSFKRQNREKSPTAQI